MGGFDAWFIHLALGEHKRNKEGGHQQKGHKTKMTKKRKEIEKRNRILHDINVTEKWYWSRTTTLTTFRWKHAVEYALNKKALKALNF